MRLRVDGADHEIDVEPDMPLLWVLRDVLGITGPKYGCGIAHCGACTVLEDGRALRACMRPVGQVRGEITTIAGLRAPDGTPGPVQRAWIDIQVAQCGYCQSGQIVSATALLARIPEPTDAEIDAAMAGNICRCVTYPRIREAVKAAARAMARD